jgi:hypothetical protein
MSRLKAAQVCGSSWTRLVMDRPNFDRPLLLIAQGHRLAEISAASQGGKERLVTYGSETTWLHAECERFFLQARKAQG